MCPSCLPGGSNELYGQSDQTNERDPVWCKAAQVLRLGGGFPKACRSPEGWRAGLPAEVSGSSFSVPGLLQLLLFPGWFLTQYHFLSQGLNFKK